MSAVKKKGEGVRAHQRSQKSPTGSHHDDWGGGGGEADGSRSNPHWHYRIPAWLQSSQPGRAHPLAWSHHACVVVYHGHQNVHFPWMGLVT